MTELPKNGWYVELPDDKNDIDLDRLNEDLNRDYDFYYLCGDKIAKFYGIDSSGENYCTDNFEDIKKFKNVTHLFLKQPEYTLNNLPEKWFVEMSDDVDTDLVEKTISKRIRPDAHRPCTSDIKELNVTNIVYGVRGENWSWSSNTDDYSKECGCINVTHLFSKKKEESMEYNKIKEEKIINIDIIEIDGKKYRKIDTGGSFENGDLVLVNSYVAKAIGYDDAVLVVKLNGEYKSCDTKAYKLEEIKTKAWHYAVYERNGKIFCSYLDEDAGNLRHKYCNDKVLECRTFEQEI